MAAVQLIIIQPSAHETILRGAEATNVTFAGRIDGELPEALVGVTLFFRWYSSLFGAEENRYSMNDIALSDPAQPFITDLAVGSHIIILAAGDQAGETEAAQNNTRHGGVTGGGEGEGRRIVHALVANLVQPSASDPIPTLSKVDATLEAEAPLQWGRIKSGTIAYEPNPEYHQTNRIGYRWRFRPRGAPAGRPSADLVPTVSQLTFDPDPPSESKPVVRFEGPLPNSLATGNYTLTLRVEDILDNATGHEVSRDILLTN